MKHYDLNSQTSIAVRQKKILDLESGELEEWTEINKKNRGGDRNFWKCYLMDFLAILGLFDSKQVDVFIYIIQNTNPTNNLFIGTYKKIAKGAHVSEPTISSIMKKLQEHDFIKKIQNGVWRINPCIMMKGDWQRKRLLISYYNEDKPLNKDLPERQKEEDEPMDLFENVEQ